MDERQCEEIIQNLLSVAKDFFEKSAGSDQEVKVDKVMDDKMPAVNDEQEETLDEEQLTDGDSSHMFIITSTKRGSHSTLHRRGGC